jgi:hypothetical protein
VTILFQQFYSSVFASNPIEGSKVPGCHLNMLADIFRRILWRSLGQPFSGPTIQLGASCPSGVRTLLEL